MGSMISYFKTPKSKDRLSIYHDLFLKSEDIKKINLLIFKFSNEISYYEPENQIYNFRYLYVREALMLLLKYLINEDIDFNYRIFYISPLVRKLTFTLNNYIYFNILKNIYIRRIQRWYLKIYYKPNNRGYIIAKKRYDAKLAFN